VVPILDPPHRPGLEPQRLGDSTKSMTNKRRKSFDRLIYFTLFFGHLAKLGKSDVPELLVSVTFYIAEL
jgi:hypothetical protein